MDGRKGYRNCALALVSSVGLLTAAGGPLYAEPLVQAAQPTPHFEPARAVKAPAIDVRRAGAALQRYVQEVVGELSADLTALSLTMIGGHIVVPPTPPPPPVVTGNTPPPPTVTGDTPPPPPPPPTTTGGGTPTPPPPPTIQGGPGPTPPPPTPQGGPGPSGAPEPATIVTGLLGLGIASAAGWYQRRRRR